MENDEFGFSMRAQVSPRNTVETIGYALWIFDEDAPYPWWKQAVDWLRGKFGYLPVYRPRKAIVSLDGTFDIPDGAIIDGIEFRHIGRKTDEEKSHYC